MRKQRKEKVKKKYKALVDTQAQRLQNKVNKKSTKSINKERRGTPKAKN